jgi:hypothetical protein
MNFGCTLCGPCFCYGRLRSARFTPAALRGLPYQVSSSIPYMASQNMGESRVTPLALSMTYDPIMFLFNRYY